MPSRNKLETEKPVQPSAASKPTSPPAKPPEKEKMTTDANVAQAVGLLINFAFNSAVIPREHFASLDQIAELLHEEPALVLTVEGHTDGVGNTRYNLDLSRRRAHAVAQYLVDHGVEANRLVAVGKG